MLWSTLLISGDETPLDPVGDDGDLPEGNAKEQVACFLHTAVAGLRKVVTITTEKAIAFNF